MNYVTTNGKHFLIEEDSFDFLPVVFWLKFSLNLEIVGVKS